jgi:hypothetical protein
MNQRHLPDCRSPVIAAMPEALAEAFQEQIATKTDLALLEPRLTIKIGAMLAAAIGILLALEKLIK